MDGTAEQTELFHLGLETKQSSNGYVLPSDRWFSVSVVQVLECFFFFFKAGNY